MQRLFILVIVILLAPICLAQTLELNSYDLKILYNKVLVENEMVFNESQDVNFTIDLPKDVSGLSLYVNNRLEELVFVDNKLRLVYSSVNKIKLSYITKELLEKDIFLANLVTPFDAENFEIKLTLPKGAVLDKPLKDSISGSIYPRPNIATTDGKSLIFEWQKQNISKDEEQAIFIQYKSKPRFRLFLWILSLIIIGLILYIISRKPKVERIIEKEEAIEIHLKEDEEQIVTILKKKEGECEQGTLRVITGFSKATLSRLLKELEERKIVYKEKRGKKNLVFLKE